ncbi:MAG: cob(I)yrinic acid a,c-diamide adenosyltransferase, partial [Dehalococcoidales bacterium]|nr:cob(I)yrinic acid a,c-diamide adenosyltransferase [Dehalococcoidales bacterium]
FIKRAMPDCGEQDALQRIGIEIVALGAGFTFGTESTGSHREYAERLWKTAVEKINSAAYDMIVLDEFSYPLHYGWVPLGEAISVLKGRPPQLHVVITGRGVPPDLIAVADTVTEMKEVKHALRSGIHAQPGIEF